MLTAIIYVPSLRRYIVIDILVGLDCSPAFTLGKNFNTKTNTLRSARVNTHTHTPTHRLVAFEPCCAVFHMCARKFSDIFFGSAVVLILPFHKNIAVLCIGVLVGIHHISATMHFMLREQKRNEANVTGNQTKTKTDDVEAKYVVWRSIIQAAQSGNEHRVE